MAERTFELRGTPDPLAFCQFELIQKAAVAGDVAILGTPSQETPSDTCIGETACRFDCTQCSETTWLNRADDGVFRLTIPSDLTLESMFTFCTFLRKKYSAETGGVS